MIKTIYVDDIGQINLVRRKGTKHIRITLPSSGGIRLSVPYGVSEEDGIKYLQSKYEWISKHSRPVPLLADGMRIGKSHTLRFVSSSNQKPTSSKVFNEIKIFVPQGSNSKEKSIQQVARRAITKALKIEADKLLVDRCNMMAERNNFKVKSVTTRALKSRWGSCSSHNDIVLNIFLLQLDWRLIDYVIIHELVHTLHHNHSQKFWSGVESFLPDYKETRKLLKKLSPTM